MSSGEMTEEHRDRAVTKWLTDFEAMLAGNGLSTLADLFHPDGYWRDLLALTWELKTFHGRAMTGVLGEFGPTVEGFFTFETELASARGYLRLVPEAGGAGFMAVTF